MSSSRPAAGKLLAVGFAVCASTVCATETVFFVSFFFSVLLLSTRDRVHVHSERRMRGGASGRAQPSCPVESTFFLFSVCGGRFHVRAYLRRADCEGRGLRCGLLVGFPLHLPAATPQLLPEVSSVNAFPLSSL